METLIIREARPQDSEALAELCTQLGYQTDSMDIPLRLSLVNNLDHHAVFIAELDQQVVGWIHVYLCPLLVSSLQAQLGGLIVHSNVRGKGIGKNLMQQAEAWCQKNACQYLSVYTNIVRLETHKFYEHLGYRTIKTEHVFRKDL